MLDSIKTYRLPYEKLPFKRKNDKWRRQHLDWAANESFITSDNCRTDVMAMQINYDLFNGIVHINDMEKVLNPEKISANYIPNNIQHMPIINSKINVLIGEEANRVFDWHVVVTNSNAISEIENEKRDKVFELLKQEIQGQSKSEEEFQQKLQQYSDYFALEYQDQRELRSNYLLNHYVKELRLPMLWNNGFIDALIVGRELYQVEIVSGEPVVRKLNPKKVRIYRSGYSNKIEDADIIIHEDYWSPGQIIDTFYDKLTEKDIKKIDRMNDDTSDDDEGYSLTPSGHQMISDVFEEKGFDFNKIFGEQQNNLPYDLDGNIRVIRMYWKSKKKIQRIKRYNKETGEPEYLLRSEYYVPDEINGEESEPYWINEAWQGTLIGKDIYVDIRPCPIQFNRMSNPSRCHFGIIGTIYAINDDTPFSLVDMMKPYSYLYDAIHDRLIKTIAHSWGTMVKIDQTRIPKGWDLDKFLYYAKNVGLIVEDSAKEVNYGRNTNTVAAGAFNSSAAGVVDATGQQIQQYIQFLDYTEQAMGRMVGITPQREGQISNRETVGGIEHSTTQSSHITEWLYINHDDTKKRVLEALLEVSKYALKGKSKKFQYILPDGSIKLMDIDGDMYAECDYGLVVDNSEETQIKKQQIDTIVQAGLQNQMLSFSTALKMYSTASMAEKQRYIEKNEQEMQQQQQMQAQQEQQAQQQQQQMQIELAKQEQEFQLKLAKIKADAQIEVANITAQASIQNMYTKVAAQKEGTEDVRATLEEKAREFNIKTTNDINKAMIKANAQIADRTINNE